jgi:UrcA family protein
MKIIAIVTAAALGLTAATLAHGQTVASTTVRYADLDIGSQAGKDALARRVANAASMVCGVESGTTDLASHIAARTCRAKAIATTMLAFSLKTAPQYASR